MMSLTCDQLINTLENDWGSYVERYRQMDPHEQKAFIQQQGYKRFADLLAHVTAWWQDGMRVVQQELQDPSFPGQNYDVDQFNAEAVERFHALSEAQVIEMFEDTRQAMLKMVHNLPEDALQDKRIHDRLKAEIPGHYAEHPFPTAEE